MCRYWQLFRVFVFAIVCSVFLACGPEPVTAQPKDNREHHLVFKVTDQNVSPDQSVPSSTLPAVASDEAEKRKEVLREVSFALTGDRDRYNQDNWPEDAVLSNPQYLHNNKETWEMLLESCNSKTSQ